MVSNISRGKEPGHHTLAVRNTPTFKAVLHANTNPPNQDSRSANIRDREQVKFHYKNPIGKIQPVGNSKEGTT